MATKSKSGAAPIQVDRESIQALAAEISSIDAKVAGATGSGTAAKNALKQKLFNETVGNWSPLYEALLENVTKLPDNDFVGFVQALSDYVDLNETKTKVDGVVTGMLNEQTAASENELTGLREARKEKASLFTALKQVAQAMGFEVADIELPRAARGAAKGQGEGGKKIRTAGKINFFEIKNADFDPDGKLVTGDWEQVDEGKNSFGSMAFNFSRVKGGDKMSSKELIDYVKAQGINWETDDEWAIKLPNGNVIGGRRIQSTESETEQPAEEQVA